MKSSTNRFYVETIDGEFEPVLEIKGGELSQEDKDELHYEILRKVQEEFGIEGAEA